MSRQARVVDPLSPRSLSLWFGVLGPPLAWGAHLVLGDLIFELGCSPGVTGPNVLGLSLEGWALIETVAVGLVTAIAGVFAYRAFRHLQRITDGTAWNRAHALALAGMASSLIYLALIVYGFMTPFFLDRCTTSL